MFCPHSVAVARYAALIRIKSPTNWDSQLTKSLFQTRSSTSPIKCPVFLDLFFIHNPPLSLHDSALIFAVHRYI
ncbi:MAG: DUF6783 domain-containing protein [Oliverpabstia sp.]